MKLKSRMIKNHKRSHNSSRNSSTSRKVRKKIKAIINRLNTRLSLSTFQRKKMVKMATVKSKVEGTIATSTEIRAVTKAKRSRSSSRRSSRSNKISRTKR